MTRIRYGDCEICGREKSLSFHHLIPCNLHKKKLFLRKFGKEEMKTRGLNLCRMCHSTIHKFFELKDLGLHYNTKDKLMENEKFANYVKWVKKQK
ncbi:hypothetical protein [Microscilla marina]|uniref:YisB n=1 Tax=Microscilla marina ATCC 23134 TaxID=313606 RepID=A1ZSQ4_MICM2|nr:hypothetical protein [Microscilla marina]EAY26634.1 YisB [Microscilla marina ATCC 23134]